MKPIITWELKQRKAYLFWWTVTTVGIIALLLLIYPSIRDQAQQLNKVLNQLPEGLRELKTGSSAVDITTPVGYLNSQLYYVTLPLLQIIMAIGLGSSLIGRDEQNHTLELLLARPVSRGKVLAAKACSGLLLMLVVAFVATLATIGLAKVVKMDIATSDLVLASLFSLLFSISFGAVAFALSTASNISRRVSTALAIALSFGGYILASLSGLSHYIQTPAKFVPYHYYNPTQILEGHISKGLVAYLVGIAVLTVLTAWLGFRRRDIA